MASEPPVDPYRTPPAMEGHYLAPDLARRSKPGWLTAICVIAIALGGLGLVHALFAIAELTVGDPFQFLLDTPAGRGAPAFEELSDELERSIRDVQLQYFAALLPLALARLVITVCLIVGGILSLQGKARGRVLLIGTFIAALLFEIGDSVVQTFIAQAMAEPFRVFGQGLDAQQAPEPNPAPALAETIMTAVLWGIMCIYYLCQAAKLLFYLLGWLYLRRPALDSLFASPAQLADSASTA